jgi:uncharacterized protein
MHMNRLSKESSPYLLQHAHNPVDWYAWNDEALARAKAEDKPILVSIGYSTCHWCHVMERESFEDADVAAVMNEHFVCIKVDREERPDVDAIYMDACQLLTGGGGWPLNCFLMPDGRPFWGGTYYPPHPAHGRPSWVQVLHHMARAWRERREEVEEQAEKVVAHIKKDSVMSSLNVDTDPLPQARTSAIERVGEAYHALSERFDTYEGGFGGAPKFPGTMSIGFLLQFYYFSGFQQALDHALLSLDKMCRGGIYDHLGGGFARYATDGAWLVPHFEKMLYDNALLVTTLSDAYKLLGDPKLASPENEIRRNLYRETIEDTLGWVAREMTHAQGGFFSAQDADSEGVEGKFFVWNQAEVEQVLKNAGFDDTTINHFCAFYDVTEHGNWEEQNILHRDKGYEAFAAQYQLDEAAFTQNMRRACRALFNVRDQRIYPGLDDKVLLSWNALMVSAYVDAYTALGNADYLATAERAAAFCLAQFFPSYTPKDDGWPAGGLHNWKDGKANIAAFLEDYAYLIDALLDLYEATGQAPYIRDADRLAQHTIGAFHDATDGLFFFTSEAQRDILFRKKEIYDNATPSANSTMARNLQRLAAFNGHTNQAQMALRMVEHMAPMVVRFPNAFGRWAEALTNNDLGIREVAVAGDDAQTIAHGLQQHFMPNTVIAFTDQEATEVPLLEYKYQGPDTYIYVCRDFACQRPVDTIEEALDLLSQN